MTQQHFGNNGKVSNIGTGGANVSFKGGDRVRPMAPSNSGAPASPGHVGDKHLDPGFGDTGAAIDARRGGPIGSFNGVYDPRRPDSGDRRGTPNEQPHIGGQRDDMQRHIDRRG